VDKVRIFLSYDRKIKFLFIEAFVLLGWARVLKSMPFLKISSSLGKQMYETSFSLDEPNRKMIRHVSNAINIMSRYTFWESMCLVKAIAAMKMLERRQIDSTMYFGTAKDESGKMIAHAWLRSGPIYLTGFEEMDQFTVVNSYAKYISNEGDNDGKQLQSQS
jgi:hypothetical protein